MTDRKLGVPKPVPPSPEEVSARRLELDVGGFAATGPTTIDVDKPVAAPSSEAQKTTKSKAEGAGARNKTARSRAKSRAKAEPELEIRRKRNVLLPHRLVPHLRDRAQADGVPHGEIVIDAFVNHIDSIRAEMAADRGDAERRKKLGLPARRRRQPRVGDDEVERRVQVGLYMSQRAISVIEEAAGEFDISWSFLVSLLLDRELAADS